MQGQESAQNEVDVVQEAQRGNREAFCRLAQYYRQPIIDVVYRLCGDPAVAEDVAQEALVRAWQRLPDYRPTGSFRGWLYRIAIHLALDSLRCQRPSVDLEMLEPPDPSETVETRMERSEQAVRVRQAVLGLPPACRAVLVLREYRGLSYREIGEALAIPTGTVMSRLNYARQLLLERLNPEAEVV